MSQSIAVARAVVRALVDGGVHHVVLAPGSRSAPLALELYDADARGDLRLHVRIDERTAAFLALGLGKGSHRPAAVATTSGTAVANLHPAVLEARHSGVPLLVLSADRPASMRGTGANQTTEQAGLFGPAVPSVDITPGDTAAAAAAVEVAARRPGPTQLNLQFADPLLPDPSEVEARVPASVRPTAHVERDAQSPRHIGERPHEAAERLQPGPNTVLVAGDDAGPPARLLAESAGWPLLAEPTSGARTGTHALRSCRLLLQTTLADDVERVVVAGHPTLSRPVMRLLSRPDVEVLSVRGRSGVCTDPGRVARHLNALPTVAGEGGPDWVAAWRATDRALSAAVDEIAATHPEGLPLLVAAEVAAAMAPQSLLVVGSSQPIRDFDLMARPYPVGERRRILGNRGLSGIDGTVSTAVGAALGRTSSRALAYLGDLTFLHDATGLVLGPKEPRPDLTIVVANDDGGAIFSTLEQGAPPYAFSFERVFGTPHRVDLRLLCAATGTTYALVGDATELRALLDTEPDGIRVLEVPIPRRGRRALDDDVQALTRSLR